MRVLPTKRVPNEADAPTTDRRADPSSGPRHCFYATHKLPDIATARREVDMAQPPATNERIVQLLLELKHDLAESKKREERIARELEQLRKRI